MNTSTSSPISEAGSSGTPTIVRVEDGVGTSLATVAQFHNADNQALAGTANGLLTGGVAQLLNPSGNIDRQRETGSDVITNVGIATGTQQLAWPVTVGPVTSGAITGSGIAQTITLSAVSGTINGIAWALIVGMGLVLEANIATQEVFTITAVNVGAKTVTGIIRNNHAISAAAIAFFYDQARSAVIPDGSTGQGLSAGATFLLNSSLNSGNGGWEGERSAAGEKDGATGTGTAIAAEYEFNAGGPPTNAGLASGLAFDRARNLQGKGMGSATQSAGGAAGATSVTVSSAAAVNTLQPGQQIRIDRNTGNEECAYVSTSYVPGTALISLQSALQFTHTAAAVEWDIFAAGGPGLNGFTPTGLGAEEEVLFNPADGKYYVERAANADGMAVANIVAEAECLFNGTTFDRHTGSVARGADMNIKAAPSVVGSTPFQNAAVTNAAVAAKSSAAGNLYGYNIANPNAALIYLQFFDVATAGAVTVGTTVPKFWLAIPSNSGVTDGQMSIPVSFVNGIQIAATTTPTGAVAPGTAIPVSLFFA